MRFRIISAVLIGALVPIFIWPQTQPGRADGQTVVINELMWMGSSASSADEWIELRNMTSMTIDLAGWRLTKKSSGQEVPMVTLPAGSVLEANGLYVISNYPNTNASSALGQVPDLVTADVALSNSALQVRLYDAAQTLIDVADDGSGNPLAGAYDSGAKHFASMERNPDPGDGSLAQHWHTATNGVGWKIGATELGTPRSINSNGRPSADAGPDQTVVANQMVNFDGSDSTDPELQLLSFTWDFGDGTTAQGITPMHSFTTPGMYTTTLSVSDGTDQTSDTTKITVQAQPVVTPTDMPQANNPELPATNTSCRGLVVSEVYPNPPSVDTNEFIELVNIGDEEVPVTGCAVWASATRKYIIQDTTVVPRGGWFVLPKSVSKLTLNNGGATVRLTDTDATELERVIYGKAAEGQTWSRFGRDWSWTTKPTAGGANVLASPPAVTKTPASKTTSSTSRVAPPAVDVTLLAVQELDSGDRVAISGTVVSPRDALGSTLVTLQSDDGGVVVSVPNGEATVEVGDMVSLTGIVRLKQGRRYVTTEAKSLRITGHMEVAAPTVMPTDDVGVEQADQLVHVNGVVALASGSTIQIDDGSGPVNVYLKSSTGIVRPKIKTGDTLDVIGVVSVATSGVRILPRMQTDLKVAQVLGVSTTSGQTVISPPAASKTQTLWYWGIVGLGGLVAGVRMMWKKFQEKKKLHA